MTRFAGFAVGCALFCAAPALAQPIRVERLEGFGIQAAGGIEVAGGTAFVRFASTVPPSARAASVAGFGGRILEEYDTGWALVELPPGMGVASGLGALKGLAGVAAVDANRVLRPSKVPADPSATTAYHLGKVNAFSAWEYEVGTSSTVTVVVMDTGIEGTHSDLDDKLHATALTRSQDCNNAPCVDNSPPTDPCGHGTEVAGVAAAEANNGIGLAGLSWGAKLVSLKIFTATCDLTAEARVIRALQYVRLGPDGLAGGLPGLLQDGAANRVVVNMSIGANAACGFEAGGAMSAETIASRDAGIVLVAAAGNYSGSSSGGPVQTPGICEGVIPVGATDESDEVAGFSARGSSLAAHGVVAPGVSVPTTAIGNGQTTATGTSFSAPIVSGMAALVLAAKPAFTAQQVKDTIRNSSEGIGISALGVSGGVRPMGETAGAGRVNAFRAMRLAINGTLAGFKGDEQAIAFPNPFRVPQHGTVTITIPLHLKSTKSSIRIYTLEGELVRDLGANTTWDGKNEGGRQVATGTYVFVVKTDAGVDRGRVAVIR